MPDDVTFSGTNRTPRAYQLIGPPGDPCRRWFMRRSIVLAALVGACGGTRQPNAGQESVDKPVAKPTTPAKKPTVAVEARRAPEAKAPEVKPPEVKPPEVK